MKTREDIKNGIYKSFNSIFEWYEKLPDEKLNDGPDGKWVCSQHLDHLYKSVTPLNKVLVIPKFFIRYKFGKPNRDVRSYEELINRYEEKLLINKGILTPTPFQPDVIPINEKNLKLKLYKIQRDKLMSKLDRWSEKNLDLYLLPHPLLGKLMIREMMYFTIHHNLHHLKILNEKYG